MRDKNERKHIIAHGDILSFAKPTELITIKSVLSNLGRDDLLEKIESIKVFSGDISKRTAGKAYLLASKIELHSELFKHEARIHSTFMHEVAHHIAYQAFECRNHGNDWKLIMKLMKLPPEPCHNYGKMRVTVFALCRKCNFQSETATRCLRCGAVMIEHVREDE